ncbi:MAG: hypothetical protein AB7K09_14525 [Planctomycetota bacterium]
MQQFDDKQAARWVPPEGDPLHRPMVEAMAWLGKGKHKEALIIADALLKDDPDLLAAHFVACRAQFGMDRPDLALPHSERLMAAVPEVASIQRFHAHLLLELNYLDGALQAAINAVTLAPDDVDSLNMLALVQRRRGDLPGAYATAQRSHRLSVATNDAEAIRWSERTVAQILQSLALQKPRGSAFEWARQETASWPDGVIKHLVLAAGEEADGETARANWHYNAAAGMDPTEPLLQLWWPDFQRRIIDAAHARRALAGCMLPIPGLRLMMLAAQSSTFPTLKQGNDGELKPVGSPRLQANPAAAVDPGSFTRAVVTGTPEAGHEAADGEDVDDDAPEARGAEENQRVADWLRANNRLTDAQIADGLAAVAKEAGSDDAPTLLEALVDLGSISIDDAHRIAREAGVV